MKKKKKNTISGEEWNRFIKRNTFPMKHRNDKRKKQKEKKQFEKEWEL